MWDEARASELRTLRIIDLSQTPQRAARKAELEIRAIRVVVKPPHARSSLPSVTYNVARWVIEVYFRVLKTGCRVEEIQLETTGRLKNCLAFYKIIAWRVLYVTYLNRECPSLPCTAVFDEGEWKSVWRITTKKEMADSPPALSEFVPLLASLGGYNHRHRDLPPGPQAIWVGIRRMTDFSIAWNEFGPGRETLVYN